MIKKLSDDFQDLSERLLGWADYADEYFLKKHGFAQDKKDVEAFKKRLIEIDAQIDAQAKTMEELWKAFNNSFIHPDALKYAIGFAKNGEDRWNFANYVGFFLAAGGRIKDS